MAEMDKAYFDALWDKHQLSLNKTLPENNTEWVVERQLDGKHVLIVILSIAAFLTNCLALGAICVIRKRLSANQTMMLSLCCADLLSAMGILARTLTKHAFPIYVVPEHQEYAALCTDVIIKALIMTGHNATLFNLLCLAVDHYCAIAKPLTYSLYMSKRRVHFLLSVFWAVSIVFGFSRFLIPEPMHDYCKEIPLLGYCDRVNCAIYEPEYIMLCVTIICMLVMAFMYGGIMLILHRYQRQGYATAPQKKAKRHIRGLITSFIILGIFCVLWLPNVIFEAYIALRLKKDNEDLGSHKAYAHAMLYLYALVILNAVCDPIIYALRMREIQEGLKTFLRFQRPTFTNKMNSFGEALRSRSSNNSFPTKYVQRQYSTNSTNTTVYSGASINERANFSRKGTMTSQVSELTEDTPLSGNISMAQFDLS